MLRSQTLKTCFLTKKNPPSPNQAGSDRKFSKINVKRDYFILYQRRSPPPRLPRAGLACSGFNSKDLHFQSFNNFWKNKEMAAPTEEPLTPADCRAALMPQLACMRVQRDG